MGSVTAEEMVAAAITDIGTIFFIKVTMLSLQRTLTTTNQAIVNTSVAPASTRMYLPIARRTSNPRAPTEEETSAKIPIGAIFMTTLMI